MTCENPFCTVCHTARVQDLCFTSTDEILASCEPVRLDDQLACPICEIPLHVNGSRLHCINCGDMWLEIDDMFTDSTLLISMDTDESPHYTA